MADIASKSPIDNRKVFETLCRTRAELFALGEYSLHDAVDRLQSWAVSNGLVEQLGQDEVQKIMAAAFGEVREDQ
jgi:hypothetical protein